MRKSEINYGLTSLPNVTPAGKSLRHNPMDLPIYLIGLRSSMDDRLQSESKVKFNLNSFAQNSGPIKFWSG